MDGIITIIIMLLMLSITLACVLYIVQDSNKELKESKEELMLIKTLLLEKLEE